MFHYNQNRMVRESVAAPVQTLSRSAEERRDMLLQDRSFYDRGRPCVRVVGDAVELFRYDVHGRAMPGTILG